MDIRDTLALFSMERWVEGPGPLLRALVQKQSMVPVSLIFKGWACVTLLFLEVSRGTLGISTSEPSGKKESL